MKKISTLFIISFFASLSTHAQITLLPSAGVQTTVSKLEGSSPVISNYKQYQTSLTGSLRGFINNSKGHGVFVGVSYINYGMRLKFYENNPSQGISYSRGIQSTLDSRPRIEIGYQFLTRKIYLNTILASENRMNSGLYFQVQPLIGLGYNFTRNYDGGHSGGGGTQLRTFGGGANFSLLTGANIYFGKNEKPWFFISIMKNSNFGRYYSLTGQFNSVHNGTAYSQNVHTMGSGMNYSIGVPIRLGGKKKK